MTVEARKALVLVYNASDEEMVRVRSVLAAASFISAIVEPLGWMDGGFASIVFVVEEARRDEVPVIIRSICEPVQLTAAAQANVDETSVTPLDDVYDLRMKHSTHEARQKLLALCLDGADEDRVEGWHEYVAEIARLAGCPS